MPHIVIDGISRKIEPEVFYVLGDLFRDSLRLVYQFFVVIGNVRFRKPNIILIVGGADKGLDMSELVAEINKICKVVILLAGTGTSRLLEARSYKLEASTHGPYDSLDQTVHKALELAKPGDAVLFSPAFASFGMFKNEYDRNDQFLTLVDKLAP